MGVRSHEGCQSWMFLKKYSNMSLFGKILRVPYMLPGRNRAVNCVPLWYVSEIILIPVKLLCWSVGQLLSHLQSAISEQSVWACGGISNPGFPRWNWLSGCLSGWVPTWFWNWNYIDHSGELGTWQWESTSLLVLLAADTISLGILQGYLAGLRLEGTAFNVHQSWE